ncbi:hypothetical protein FHS09_001227 [Microbulbifer rhizosphaerae]|uniref:Uncharacterized protein n=1 Tax=Microbulbifer rhizosphaerae TaxID=1562603 RepID=A0A7W4WB21_9GAMM|nr:hypothetical protein [Microbulbifer rhizosphaerae]
MAAIDVSSVLSGIPIAAMGRSYSRLAAGGPAARMPSWSSAFPGALSPGPSPPAPLPQAGEGSIKTA